jgi:hypothetical protein
MTAKRTRLKLDLTREDIEKLRQWSISRTGPYDQVTKARILLAYHEGESKSAIARSVGPRIEWTEWCGFFQNRWDMMGGVSR